MLSTYEFVTLMLVRQAPDPLDMNRAELDTRLERQLVMLGHCGEGTPRVHLTGKGRTFLDALHPDDIRGQASKEIIQAPRGRGMSDIPITRAEEDALYERIRLMMFSADLPVQRLEPDIEDLGRFTQPDARSPHVRLVEAMPPLAPAAEAIVRAMIRAYGVELFGRGRAQTGLCAMIKTGPVAFGQTALMLGPDAPVPSRARALVEEFNHIFERHPRSGFAQARRVLAAIGLPSGPGESSEVRRA